MFVALEVTKRPSTGILSKLKGILSRPKIWVEPRECCGADYAVMCAQEGGKGLNWEEIEWLAKDYSRWILLPPGVSLPQNTLLRAYTTEEFDRQVLLHTACSVISRTKMPMYRRVLGLLDEDGSFAYMLPRLLKYYTSVRVVTHNLSVYARAGEQMMEELGAPVIVGQDLSGLSECVLVLCPGDFAAVDDVIISCPVLCGGTLHARYRYDCINELRVRLPDIAQPPPEGIDAHLFAGALYALGEVAQVSLRADTLLYNHRVSNFNDAVRAVVFKGLSAE